MVPMRDKPKEFSGSIPWVRIEDFDGKYLYESKSRRCVDTNTIEAMKLKVYPPGTVLCSCSARLGVCTIAGVDLVSNQTFIGLVPDSSAVSSEFLFYRMLSHADDLQRLSSGTTIAYLSREKFEEFEVLAPPLPEQQKIAAILSSVDDVVEKTRAQIDKLKDLKTGMMQELLTKGIEHTAFKDSPVGRIPEGWDCIRLGDVLDFKNGVNKGKEAFGHGVPIISYKNVYSGGGIDDSDLNSLVDMNERELDRFRVKFGDVFFTRTSETPDEIGFANVYLGSRDDVVFNGFVIRGRQNAKLFDPSFLKYAFQSNSVRKQMMDNSKFTTRAGISGESLSRVLIAIPDIAEQEKIANALGTIDSMISSSNEKLKSVMSLKRALMQDLLTGKVRVNVDNKENAVA
jgi:type I restriction enzyme S subunit